jgi:hypothetical protein
MSCEWCRDPETLDDAVYPELLCWAHRAEHAGLTVDAMQERDRIQYEEERASHD